MGLDVCAYRTVELVLASEMTENRDRDNEGETYLWEGPAVNRMAPLVPGFYRYSPESAHFRAGSYSGYGRWRSQLARLAGLAETDAAWDSAGPFAELVYFADNEGAIGSVACAKLARDFAEWRDRAKAYAATLGGDGDWFLSRYEEWERAFNIAKDGGVVKLC